MHLKESYHVWNSPPDIMEKVISVQIPQKITIVHAGSSVTQDSHAVMKCAFSIAAGAL
jgi:hypothetical protein